MARAYPPLRGGFIAGVCGFVVTCIWATWVICQDTNSTAAIGLIFVPVEALMVAIPCFCFGLCIQFSGAAFRDRRRLLSSVWTGVALMLLLPFLYWFGSGIILCKVVRDVREMNGAEIAQFLETSPWKHNRFALNAVLEHQDLDAERLLKIAEMPSPELHERMGSFFPVMGHNKKGLAVMRLVASHPNADSPTLAVLSASPNDYVLGDVAGNPNTPSEILERLAKKGGYLIEWGLAKNQNTAPATLHDLVSSTNEYTRAALARNQATTLDDLDRLSKDPVWHVRDSLLMNPSCSQALRESLRNDPDERISHRFK